MNLRLVGRHVKITPALRRYIADRVLRLDRFGLQGTPVQVLVGVDKLRHTAEALVILRGRRIQARAVTSEMYASVDKLVDKLATQLRKHKERLVARKGRAAVKHGPPAERLARQEVPAFRVTRPTLPRLSVEEARDQLRSRALDFLIYLDATTSKVQLMHRLGSGDIQLVDPQG